MSENSQPSAADVALFGNRFVTQEVPSREFPADRHAVPRTRCGWSPRTSRSRVTRLGTWRPS